METDHGECAEGRTAALWTTAPTCVRGQQKGPDRTVAGVGRRSNHFAENVRRKMGARGIRTYALRANAGAGVDVNGEMGPKAQEAYAKKNGDASGVGEVMNRQRTETMSNGYKAVRGAYT